MASSLRINKGGSIEVPGQQEMAGMPERNEIGQAVIEFINARSRADRAVEEMQKAREDMVNLMVAAGKYSIRVEKVHVTLLEKAGFKVQITPVK